MEHPKLLGLLLCALAVHSCTVSMDRRSRFESYMDMLDKIEKQIKSLKVSANITGDPKVIALKELEQQANAIKQILNGTFGMEFPGIKLP